MGIWADHLIKMQPDVSYHVNGGPIAMPDADFPRLVNETKIAMQVCTAGNLRTALLVGKLLAECRELERLLIATDTPTGSGIMPLGMLYTMSHLASLGGIEPEIAVAMPPATMPRFIDSTADCSRRGEMPTWCWSMPAAGVQRTMPCRRSRTATSWVWAPSSATGFPDSSAAAAIRRKRRAVPRSPTAACREISARNTEQLSTSLA